MNYPRNCWYVASWSHDLLPQTPLPIEILGESIVIWRSKDGQVHALEDRCPHRFAPLSLGRCEGENLRCMYHGFLLNSEGQAIQIPGQERIPPQARVRNYPVEDRHGWIWIWMGRIEDADVGLIPCAFGPDDEQWVLGCGYLDYEAEAGLINDNLLDFSHISYVHANSFGAGDTFANNPPRIQPLDRGVRISRWERDTSGPGSGGRAAPGTPIDWWQSYDYLVPGILIMQSASFPLGSADRFGPGGPDDIGQALRAWAVSSQAVTPIANRKARYFFSTGPHRGHGGEAERDQMVDVARLAFAEDKVMIEAQQKVISGLSGQVMVPSVHDRAVTIFNGVVRKMIAQERHDGEPAAPAGLDEMTA